MSFAQGRLGQRSGLGVQQRGITCSALGPCLNVQKRGIKCSALCFEEPDSVTALLQSWNEK